MNSVYCLAQLKVVVLVATCTFCAGNVKFANVIRLLVISIFAAIFGKLLN